VAIPRWPARAEAIASACGYLLRHQQLIALISAEEALQYCSGSFSVPHDVPPPQYTGDSDCIFRTYAESGVLHECRGSGATPLTPGMQSRPQIRASDLMLNVWRLVRDSTGSIHWFDKAPPVGVGARVLFVQESGPVGDGRGCEVRWAGAPNTSCAAAWSAGKRSIGGHPVGLHCNAPRVQEPILRSWKPLALIGNTA